MPLVLEYKPEKIELRRFEVQIHHHAAYLFWNFKGLIAERWAHGPYFDGYAGGDEAVQMQSSDARIAVYGLKAMAFNHEVPKAKAAKAEKNHLQLSDEFFGDCLEVLQPRVVNRLSSKVFYSYPIEESEIHRVADSMNERYPGVELQPEAFEPTSGQTYSGITYQSRWRDGEVQHLTQGIFGIYHRDQRSAFFNTLREDDPEWAIGLTLDRVAIIETDLRGSKGFKDPLSALHRERDTILKEAQLIIGDHIVPTFTHG